MKVERRFYKNGKLMEEEYCNERGLLHRDGDKPAYIRYYRNGKIQSMMWYKNGKLHRDGDKPAEIYYHDYIFGRIAYYKNGKLHRDGDKPALMTFIRGKLCSETYYKDDKQHRDGDKPASIVYYSKGKIREKMWLKNNQIHRDGAKPAVIEYDENGKVIRTVWYKYGVEVSEDFCKQDFSKLDPVKVLKTRNVQRRMLLIQLIGLDNLLRKLKGESLGVSPDKQYELLCFNNIFSTPMKVLKMRCPTVGVYYLVPVHPKCNTWEEGLNFYYGGRKYNFLWEK